MTALGRRNLFIKKNTNGRFKWNAKFEYILEWVHRKILSTLNYSIRDDWNCRYYYKCITRA